MSLTQLSYRAEPTPSVYVMTSTQNFVEAILDQLITL
jgi:hypothetical protein